jgi:hypothetical protein
MVVSDSVVLSFGWFVPRKPDPLIHFPLSLGNGRSPHGYINQRLQTQFRVPYDERCEARNMLSIQ